MISHLVHFMFFVRSVRALMFERAAREYHFHRSLTHKAHEFVRPTLSLALGIPLKILALRARMHTRIRILNSRFALEHRYDTTIFENTCSVAPMRLRRTYLTKMLYLFVSNRRRRILMMTWNISIVSFESCFEHTV